jgi:hypothetical protein
MASMHSVPWVTSGRWRTCWPGELGKRVCALLCPQRNLLKSKDPNTLKVRLWTNIFWRHKENTTTNNENLKYLSGGTSLFNSNLIGLAQGGRQSLCHFPKPTLPHLFEAWQEQECLSPKQFDQNWPAGRRVRNWITTSQNALNKAHENWST